MIRIEPIRPEQFETLLPMIADYQRFYEVEDIDEERNRDFFARFIDPSVDGTLIAARTGPAGRLRCLDSHQSSLSATETVLMNDLYVDEAARGKGAGRALIEAAAEIARDRGAHSLERLLWRPTTTPPSASMTSTGAARSEWVEYELPVE